MLRERVCPECGRKFKVAIGREYIIVIPQDALKIKDCPKCGHIGRKE